jgi:hypothetical protein
VRPIRAWNGFWFGPISARPLAAFRIAFGLVVLLNLALLSLEADYWFTDAGLLRGTEAREAAGPLRQSLLHYVQDPASVHIFFGAMLAVCVLFTLGWHTRVMGFLLYLGLVSIHHRNISSTNGADVFLVIMVFYLTLSPCGAAYSLDARRKARKRGTLAEPLIIPWAQRLAQLHFALIYLNTGLLKAAGATWQNGTALHYVLCNTEFRLFNLEFLTQYPLIINFMTHSTLIIELSLPFLLWRRATRPWAIAAGLALHGAIVFTVNIPIFSEAMIACYLAFLGPDELDAMLRALNPGTWLARLRFTSRSRQTSVSTGQRADAGVRGLPAPHLPEFATAERSMTVTTAEAELSLERELSHFATS